MIAYLTAYGVAAVTLLSLDYLWLAVIAKDFFRAQLGHLMLDEVKIGIAAFFYLFYAIGILMFAVKPALSDNSLWLAVSYGAFFGFLAYGTYDVTNMATLKDWPVFMSIVDIAWGTFVTALTAGVTYVVMKKFGLTL